MISHRQADLLQTLEDEGVYEPLWDFLRNMKGNTIIIIKLIRCILSKTPSSPQDFADNKAGLPRLPQKISGNFDIIPPEQRQLFREWVAIEGGVNDSLRTAKYVHDRWIAHNRGVTYKESSLKKADLLQHIKPRVMDWSIEFDSGKQEIYTTLRIRPNYEPARIIAYNAYNRATSKFNGSTLQISEDGKTWILHPLNVRVNGSKTTEFNEDFFKILKEQMKVFKINAAQHNLFSGWIEFTPN